MTDKIHDLVPATSLAVPDAMTLVDPGFVDQVRKHPPMIIAAAGPKAAESFLNFFLGDIENPNTRAAYFRAVTQFDSWCRERGIGIHDLKPWLVSGYRDELKNQGRHPQTIKQHLAALSMLFDNMVVDQVIPVNPISSVKRPKYSAAVGVTPAIADEDTVKLLTSIDTSHIVGLRDRALIGLLAYSFARVGAAVSMRVGDFYPSGRRWKVRLHEKGGKFHEVWAHHSLEEYLHSYIEAAEIADDKAGPLFRTTRGTKRELTTNPFTRKDALKMIKRRLKDAGISEDICCHSFRAGGITNFLRNGGSLETAQALAAHSSPRTTKIYDRRNSEVSLSEIERVNFGSAVRF